MNTMGCSVLFLAAAALVVSFIPILGWITFIVALPLAVIGVVVTGLAARKVTAQPADKSIFWMAVALCATIILRMTAM